MSALNGSLQFSWCCRSLFAVAWLTTLSGCGGGSSGPTVPMVPVTGTVRLDSEPLVGAVVMFHPIGTTKGNGGFAITDDEGKFSLTDHNMRPGCPPGEYGVTFSKITQPDGSPIPPGAQRGEVGMVEQIPAVYSEFKPHTIIQGATVKTTETSLDFRLDSKFRPPHSFHQN